MSIKRCLGIHCVVVAVLLRIVGCDQAAEAPAQPPTASPPTQTKSTSRTPPPPIIAAAPTPPHKAEVPTRPVEPVVPAEPVVSGAPAVPAEPVVEAAASSPPTTPPPPLDLPAQLRAAQAELGNAQAAFEAVKEELLVSLRGTKEHQSLAKESADLEAEVKRLRANSQDVGSVSLKSLGAKSDLARMEKAALARAKADPKYFAAERQVAKRAAVVADLQRQIAQRDAALLAQRQAEEAAVAERAQAAVNETAPRTTYEQPRRSRSSVSSGSSAGRSGSSSVGSSGGSVQCSGTTQKGNRCRRMTTSASGRCYQH